MLYKKITTVIPVYNSEKYIERTINSVINQKYSENEIILINDASTDGSEQICEQFEKKYSQIKFINLSENKGVSNARNIGIRNATGEYIHFLDSDDTIEDGLYEYLNYVLNKYEYDLIVFGSNTITNNKIIETKNVEQEKVFYNQSVLAEYLRQFEEKDKSRVLNVIWNKLYSLKVIRDNNITFNTKIDLGEDFIFNCYYFKFIKTYYETHNCYYNYFKHEGENLTSKFRNDVLSRRKLMYKELVDLYKFYNIYDKKVEKELKRTEGIMIYISLYTLCSDTCKLSYGKKIIFLSDILKDEHMKYVLIYKQHGLEHVLLKYKCAKLQYLFMQIKTKLKNIVECIKNK